jgi:OmpA-OmpF porin, OOP family
MSNTFNSRQTRLAAACALALGVFSTTSIAQIARDEHALVTDSSGTPVMSGFGLCVRSGFGPAPEWTSGCHVKFAAPLAQYVAPAERATSAPAVAPVAVTSAAPAPVWEKVAFDANVLFDSDSSALRPAGRDTLDQFVGKMHGLDTQSVFAIGYADRMGTSRANQILSQQRVDTVKAYLVGKGIASDRVQASARGETQPSTFAGECKDANNVKNVACMQADRHVFIEVSGSRIVQ